MEFHGTTFALEIINFLVLVWLLQRLLYKPVTEAIARRQAGIEEIRAEARRLRCEAETLKEQYENRMAEWEKEKTLARQQLLQELEAERVRLRAALQTSLDEERDRQRALEQRRFLDLRHQLEEQAKVDGGRFVARLLSRLSSPDLEEGIRRLLLEDLPQLPERQLQPLRAAGQAGGAKITSAYPLALTQRAGLAEALQELAGNPVVCEFAEDARLLAGLRISLGPWMVRASLVDELQFFAGAPHDGSGH